MLFAVRVLGFLPSSRAKPAATAAAASTCEAKIFLIRLGICDIGEIGTTEVDADTGGKVRCRPL